MEKSHQQDDNRCSDSTLKGSEIDGQIWPNFLSP